MSRVFVTSVGCIGSLLVACASHDANDESGAGQVSLAVAATPSDVQCLVIQASTPARSVSRQLSVTPGQAIATTVGGLPTGSVSIGASAYPTACSAVSTNSAPNWQSDPATQTITLTRGATVAVNLVLRPSGSVSATVDWQDDNVGGSSSTGGTTSTGGTATGGTTSTTPTAVVSAQSAYWQTTAVTEITSGIADVTVNDATAAQTWEGFGGTFNELGWSYLTTQSMRDQAMQMLFGADGCNFTWGRIPIGASDYAMSRYSADDTGSDVTPNSDQSNRPPADPTLSMFSLSRDSLYLIPYIKAAQAVKPDMRFWAGAWTPPSWMKSSYNTGTRPSYYDGGSMVNAATNLNAYAQYYTRFVQGYRDQGVNIELVSPQNEPGYDQNYPSCLWDRTTYTAFVGQYLGPAMRDMGVRIMLGTLSNPDTGRDLDLATAVLADATARSFVSVVGAQWGVLDRVNSGTSFGGLPVWASTHKCGNYPWSPSGYPPYNATQAPNDYAYGIESWGYIRDAITKGRVTSYSAWNMVLDRIGLGLDTSRDWKQNALLVANSGTVTATPTYYVFRHFAQFVRPGATVVGTAGGDAVAFRNPDNTVVAVMYNSGAARTSIVRMAGKLLQVNLPSNGWATIVSR